MSSTNCGTVRVRPTSRIATCGGLMIGVEYVPPTEPRLLIVNVPPCSRSRSNLPSRTVVGQLVDLGGDLRDALAIGIAQHGHDQAALGVDGDADVDVLLVDDLVVLHVDRGVEHRVPLERRGDGLDEERHRR